jgi:hypothetical protein
MRVALATLLLALTAALAASIPAGAGTARAPDLHLSVVGPTVLPVDVPTTYTLQLGNTGRRARGITIVVQLPDGVYDLGAEGARCRRHGDANDLLCTVATIRSGGFRSIDLRIGAKRAGFGVISAWATSGAYDRNAADNGIDRTVVFQPLPGSADVSVSIGPATVPSPTVTPLPYGFSVTVANSGPGSAVRVIVRYEHLPLLGGPGAITWPYTPGDAPMTSDCDPNVGPRVGLDIWRSDGAQLCMLEVPPGETRTFGVWLTGPAGATWTARVDSLTPDANPANNVASASL